jgi:glycolate oxidase
VTLEGLPPTDRRVGPYQKIALVFTKMNKILEIDKENRVAVVQPGVINMDFQKELTKYGLYYPPDPGSMAVTTMGGNVAENAGARAVKYGVTRHLGMEVVLLIKSCGRVQRHSRMAGQSITLLRLRNARHHH